MTTIDLNADLGESFGPWQMGSDTQMMDIITSANIACGGHAGDYQTMHDGLKMASEKNVVAGAHPGFEDKQGFGRRILPLTAREVEFLIAAQVGTIKGIAELAGNRIAYVKAHGALSNWAMANRDIADAIVRSIKQAHPDCAILAVSGTELEKAAKQIDLEYYCEIFADRGYTDEGLLVSRSEEGALITDAKLAADRLIRFFDSGEMPTASGGSVALEAHSICIHGDNPHAVALGAQIKADLEASGVTFAPFIKS